MDQNAGPRCRLSDPAHPHTLRRQDNPRPSSCFGCGTLGASVEDSFNDWHYYFDICKLVFHEECNIVPRHMRHPYHPKHLIFSSDRLSDDYIHSFENDSNVVNKSDNNACDWCGKSLGILYYRCIKCNFRLDIDCMREDPPLTITDSETHQHPLTLFPKPLVKPCRACGLGGNNELSYACEPCNYLVHKSITNQTSHQDHVAYIPCLPCGLQKIKQVEEAHHT